MVALRQKVAAAPVVMVAERCLPERTPAERCPAVSPNGGAVVGAGAGPGAVGAGSALPGGPGGGNAAAAGSLESARPDAAGASRAPEKNWKDPVLEPLVRALRSLGYRAEEARERIQEAAGHFVSLGQAAREEQILKRALMHRRLREKMDAREAAKAKARAAAALTAEAPAAEAPTTALATA